MSAILSTKDLTKAYQGYLAVNHLNMNIQSGTIYGLLGRNGAGKTTLMKMILNLVNKTGGEIYFLDNLLSSKDASAYRQIGSIIESPCFYSNLTAFENLKILSWIRGNYCPEEINQILEMVGLENDVHKIFSAYSLGMKQRLGIAAALIHKPKLLILDEPMNGLDPIGIQELRRILHTLSRVNHVTILISSHLLSEIELIADVIGVMHHGQLIDEIDLKTFHETQSKIIELQVNQSLSASKILNDLNITFEMTKNQEIFISKSSLDICEINKLLVENNISVRKLLTRTKTVEEYFHQMIGGHDLG